MFNITSYHRVSQDTQNPDDPIAWSLPVSRRLDKHATHHDQIVRLLVFHNSHVVNLTKDITLYDFGHLTALLSDLFWSSSTVFQNTFKRVSILF